MRFKFFFTALVVLTACTAPAAAVAPAADAGSATDTWSAPARAATDQVATERSEVALVRSQPSGNNSSSRSGERIDADLTLLDSSYDEDAGTATLTFRVDGAKAVTLVDAGAFMQGGEVPRRTLVLQPGTTSVELPVTESDAGYVGVSISTQNVLYAELIRPEKALLPGLQSEYSGLQLFGAVVLSSMVGVGVVVLLTKYIKGSLMARRSL